MSTPSLLIVDDEVGPAESLRMIFKSVYEVLTAKDAESALAIMRERPVDVITLDLQMPSMPGMELLQAFRAIDPRVEVVLITGCPVSDEAIREAAANGVDYVCKPFDVEHARGVVELAMARRQRRSRTADTEWLNGFAHDIRTPVAAIIGYTDILSLELDAMLDDMQRNALQRILVNADLLLHLMDCAYISKSIDDGTFTALPISFDIVDMIRQLVTRLLPVAGDNNIQVTTDLPAGELYITNDRDRLRLALWALLAAALKCIPSGRIELRVHSPAADRAHVSLRLHGAMPGLMALHESVDARSNTGKRQKLLWLGRLLPLLGGHMQVAPPKDGLCEILFDLSSQPHSQTGVPNDDDRRTDHIHRVS